MARERSDSAALFDMLQAAEAILRHIAGRSRDDYEREELLRHAVERNIEIIGEAARRLSAEFRERHPTFHGGPSWRHDTSLHMSTMKSITTSFGALLPITYPC